MTVFVDTGAWFALAVQSDADHVTAIEWLENNERPLVTTDYVIDELLTLLMSRVNPQMAIRTGETLLETDMAHIEHITEEDIAQAWAIFKRHHDKRWSFTDCTSKVVIERLGIQEAFAFDKHFEQFGSVVRVPN